MMQGSFLFDVVLTGKGSHAAKPDQSRDAISVAAALTQNLEFVVSRNVVPVEPCVLSGTQRSVPDLPIRRCRTPRSFVARCPVFGSQHWWESVLPNQYQGTKTGPETVIR
jgi:hypothetical protein